MRADRELLNEDAGGAARAVEVTVIYYPRTRAGRWLVNDVTRI